jgi:hypothetical protein
MKNLIAALALILTSTSAFAHGGSHHVACHSAAESGSKQYVEFSLNRANGVGLVGPAFTVGVNGKRTSFQTDDEMKTFGETTHNSPLGVIMVSATNDDQEGTDTHGRFTLTAIPSTVKAFTADGKRNKWSLKAEQDECNDANGSAKFKAIFRGNMNTKLPGDKYSDTTVEVQILDCEMEYNSGMAC